MKPIKFVLIGGGSYNWTYKLFTDIALTPALSGIHVVLQDINPEHLKHVSQLCRVIADKAGAKVVIETSTDLDSSLKGADFVGLTINTRGEEGDSLDHSIPAKYGILQTVGDTVGPGGWARALRNIPVVVDIIHKVEKYAPKAWFMNYSNPMSVLTRTIQKVSSVRSFGICHELQGILLHLAYYLNVDWRKDFTLKLAGINHNIWILDMAIKGEPGGLKKVREFFDTVPDYSKNTLPPELAEGGGANPPSMQQIKAHFLRQTGYLPCEGDRHLAEFFSYFITKQTDYGKKWGVEGTGIDTHAFAAVRIYEKRKQRVMDLLSGKKPIWLHHSHEHAAETIAALAGFEPLITPINTANIGQIDNLPRQAVVETLALVDAVGVRPLPVGNMPQTVVPYIMPHILNQEMTVEAGLTGNRELAIEALANDPMIPDPDTAVKIANDFFEAFKENLPQFNGKWK